MLTSAGIDVDTALADADGKFASAFVRATKPRHGAAGYVC
jgi:hypothetical protein